MRAVGRFVASKADVAVNARKIFSGAPADQKFPVEFTHRRRHTVEQRAKRLDDVGAVALAICVHPRLVIVASELAEKTKCFRSKDCFFFRHPAVSSAETFQSNRASRFYSDSPSL